ncbi:Peptidoglycan-binding LysM [Sulfitobacter indolifex HEL-45]|uniref:Peptidoglycan-binding LysM n=2 Tax=Sulfitobacter indolifex TaxID=225422 RepID=A0ABM9X4L6_9RHOB|nr:Peptidoglycan-binding LysM [Sulfitobacter indolifex HEL-45]
MAAGAFAAAVLALGAWIGSKRAGPEDAPQSAVAVVPERDATPENATLAPNAVQGVSVGPEGAAATAPDAPVDTSEVAPNHQAPTFDEVRRESDGMTVIAGRAAPGSTVLVLKDGEEIASATADGSGKFATLAMVQPSETGHVLTLLGQDGANKIASEEEIILTPTASPDAPVELAQADTAPKQSPLDLVEETADLGAQSEGAAAKSAEAEGVPETQDTTPLAGAGTAQEQSADAAPSEKTRDSDGPAETSAATDSEATLSDTAPEPATPLAGTATSVPQNAEAEGQMGTTTAATPLADTGTAQVDNTVAAGQAAPTSEAGQINGATDPAQATPLSGTGTDASDASTSAEQTRAAKEGGASDTETDPAQATPLSGVGTTNSPAPTGQNPDGAEVEGLANGTAPTPATPLAETGTAEPEVPSNAEPSAQATLTPDTTTVPESTAPAFENPAAPETAPTRPPAPAPVLKSTADGVERLDTAPPQVMTNVALDTIGYSDQGDVQLAGRAQPDTSEVRVYLNNNAVISLPVDQEGRWRGDLPNVDEGVYTLRVDELSSAGDVTSRVETPFKRESPEVLAAATEGQTGPLNAVTVQKGDTLWAISRDRYGDPLLYVKVFEANSANIGDPDLIYPGQVFDLPEEPASE